MREFLELADVDSFMKIAENANLIVRIDPYVFINVYGLIFYINLGNLDKRDVRRVIVGLKDKIVVVKNIEVKGSIHQFLKDKDKG